MPRRNAKSQSAAYTAHQLVARRIAELMQERAHLEEEVLQLRAAVQIWTAVAEQTAVERQNSHSLAS